MPTEVGGKQAGTNECGARKESTVSPQVSDRRVPSASEGVSSENSRRSRISFSRCDLGSRVASALAT